VRDHRTCWDLFIRRLTRKLTVASVNPVPTCKPQWLSDRMVPARDDFPLSESPKLLALRQRQVQSRDVARITRAIDNHIDTSARLIGLGFHQAQNPPYT
jgi:hypothetical protein